MILTERGLVAQAVYRKHKYCACADCTYTRNWLAGFDRERRYGRGPRPEGPGPKGEASDATTSDP